MAINKIPESQLPTRSVSETDYVRVVGADGKSYRVPKTDFNGGGGGGTVDPSLSPTSTNAVQNKAIYNALSDLKDDIGDLDNLTTTAKSNLVAAINEAAQSGGGGALTQDTKQALLQCFAHTAWTDDQGQTYYDDLEDALYPFDLLSSITAVYTQSGTVYDTDSLNSLKADLVVTGNYSDGTYNQTTKYTLSGTLTVGTSTITASYGGKTATFTVTVTQSAAVLTSISAVYTQSGTVYDTDTLDSLKTDLVVTAHYSDSSSETLSSSDYTLSGSLTVGTSTITVTYSGKTTTFTVTVTDYRSVMSYTYSDGELYKYRGTITNDTTFGHLLTLNDQSTNIGKRRVFAIERGKAQLYETDAPTSEASYVLTDPALYPIPVPPTATSVAIAITPSTQYFGISGLVLSDGKYSLTLDDGWTQGSKTLTFVAETYTHIILNCKQNSSGTAYGTEPTEMTVVFS